MAVWLIWLLLSGILIVAEILTLSLYLLLAGIGALLGAALAFFGTGIGVQITAATILTLISWALLTKFRPQKKHPDSRTNPDLNMDIGTDVKISDITPDGKLSVMLRGARWDAKLDHNTTPDLTATYKIVKIDGSILILKEKH